MDSKKKRRKKIVLRRTEGIVADEAGAIPAVVLVATGPASE